jgi:putative membrane-bound dehydrogenase-like protein
MSRWLPIALFLGIATSVHAQLPPDKALASLKVADGLQVELFAAEPMVINPTSIDVDHLGRVWVCEAVNYRNKMFKKPLNRPEGDRIQILVDKDGDGKADEAITFYQGPEIYGPLGICVLARPSKEAKGGFAYRVLVCQSPDILEFWDRDGDGKADGPPKKFLTGFRGFDHDHGVHGINVGPDGKLYFTVGDQGVDGLQSSDGKGRKWKSNNTDCQAGTVWRCDQDGTNLELIAHNFRNNYECCVNSFGEIWLSDNDDDGNQQTRICHVMPGGNYGYFPRGPGQSHWHEEQPGIVHKTLRTGFGSPTGICFYEGTLLPEKYRGQLLHTDAGPREFRAFHIKPKGAGYELTQENLVTSSDNWFRLSDVCVAPDGSVMLADWYDPGVGGHGMGDWTRGRIYRVTPKGHKGYKVPAVKLDTTEELISMLESSCLASRALGRAAVNNAPPIIASRWLAYAINSAIERKRNDNLALHMFAMTRLRAGNPPPWPDEVNAAILKFSNYRWTTDERLAALTSRLSALVVKEPHKVESHMSDGFFEKAGWSGLREALVVRAKQYHAIHYVNEFYRFAKLYDGQDIFYRAALNIACGTDPERRKAILADFDKHFPEWNDKVADLVWELRPASTLPRLCKLLEDSKLTAAQRGRIVDILVVYDDADAGKTMIALLGREVPPEIKSRAIENLKNYLPTKWNSITKSDELKNAIDDLLKVEKTRVTGLQLAAAAGAVERAEAIGDIADNIASPLEIRREAITSLSKLRSVHSIIALDDVMCTRKDPLAEAAASGLGALVTGQVKDKISELALTKLKEKLLKNDDPMPLMRAILSALAGTRQGTDWLLSLKEKGELSDQLVADAGRLLRNSPFQAERNKAMLLFPAPGKLDPKKLPPISELAKRKGDVKRGEAILAASLKSEAQCLRCHTVRGVGGNIGPDQSMIGKKASKENLLESILLPSKAIADQYVQWKVDTIDMKSVTGLLVEETATNITLRDANGKDHTFALKDLDGPKQKSLVSIMPDNLVSALTEDELIDLVEYMLTLKTASLTPETWHILGPFANDASDSALDKDLGLESLKAIDLSATLTGRDGPVKWSTARVNGSGYLDLMAHYAGKSPMSASYLYRVIESPIEQAGSLLYGNDDGAKIWINGEKVFENRDHFAATPGRHSIPVKLKKGLNAVLIKIVNGSDPHGFYFALTSEQELKVTK